MSNDLDDLRESINIPEKRIQLAEILSICSMLSDCIIDSNYRLSDEWIAPLAFTELGQKIASELLKNHKRLKPNDAKMAVFLRYGCADGLLIDPATDLDHLRRQISSELLNGRIFFPYIFGRELHDAAARLYPARTTLDNKQTIKLLKELPIGVFQDGRTVVGPYGCTYSDMPRQADARKEVPGYLCSNAACDVVHSLHLSTGNSSIVRARNILGDYLEKHYSQTADEHIPLIHDAIEMEYLPRSSFSRLNLLDLLSDGLSEDELRTIIDRLLRRTFKTEGRRRDIAVRLGAAIMNPTEFVAGIGRPHLLQIALLHSDEDLITAIDETMESGSIELRDFEVRIGKLDRWDSTPPHAEIGKLGVHFTAPPSFRHVPRRVLELLHNVYYESDIWDAGDLAYALEAPNDLSDGELLDRAVRQYTPRELFTRLILPNKRAAHSAASKLGIFGHESMSRGQLLESMLWKIGEPSPAAFTDVTRVEGHLKKLVDANMVRQSVDVLRSHAANLFAALEEALSRALMFCVWALTTDHYLSSDAFEYDPALDPEILNFIEINAPADEPELRLKLDTKNTLLALSAGFARLAKALRRLDVDEYKRPAEDIPKSSVALSRPFAFPYSLFFLNLEQRSMSDVLTALQATSRLLQNDPVIDLRNSFAHGNHPLPEPEIIESVLDRISKVSAQLRFTGFYPRSYELQMVSRDNLGREELTYRSGDDQISLFRPSWAIAPKLPNGDMRLIIMPIAKTVASGPLRFLLKPRPGSDPYWEGWPKRWHVEANYSNTEHLSPDQSGFAETG